MTLLTRTAVHELITTGIHSPVFQKLVKLFGGQIAAGALALIYIWAVNRLLGAADFGRFAFLRAFLSYIGLFAEFGLAMSTGRLLALSNDGHEQSALCGTWLILFSPLILLGAVIIASGTWWVDPIFKMDVSNQLLFLALPAISIPLHMALRLLLRGHGNTDLLAIHETLPWLLALLLAFALWYTQAISEFLIAFSFTLSYSLTVIFTLTKLKVNLRVFTDFARKVLMETKRFGLRAYWGLIVGTGSFQLDIPLLAYFTRDKLAIGFYALSKMLVAPINMLSGAISIVLYRRFAVSRRLPTRVVILNMTWLIVASAVTALLAWPIITLFAPEYINQMPVLYIWIVVAVIQGAYSFPNTLLDAAGYGSILQKMANLFAIANLILNFTLIPWLGAVGASLASAGAYLLWLILCIYYYRQINRQEAAASQ